MRKREEIRGSWQARPLKPVEREREIGNQGLLASKTIKACFEREREREEIGDSWQARLLKSVERDRKLGIDGRQDH